MDQRYRLTSRPVADPRAVVQGPDYRITVLTEGLLRLEWSADGAFEDRASAFAINRELPAPAFEVVETESHLEVLTDRLHLVYDRGPFSTSGLSVQVRGGVSSWHSVWRYGDRPADGDGNLGGTARTLDMIDGPSPLEPGVLSRNGYAMIDDSRTLVLDSEGWVSPRSGDAQDLYVFAYGRDYPQALRALYALSGPQPLLPRWALGNWWSRYHRYSAEEYLTLLDRFATRASHSRWQCSTWTGTWSTSTPSTAAAGPATPGTATCSPTLPRSWPNCTGAGSRSPSTTIPPTACAPTRTPTRRWPRRWGSTRPASAPSPST